ncbi:glycoside hydrolase 43 family protein [Clostridioides difficile]
MYKVENCNISDKIIKRYKESSIKNPIIWADFPDPDVIRVNDIYYMVSTTMHMTPGVPIMRSYDLINWDIVNYVYDILEDGESQILMGGKSSYGKGSWASSIRYNNGKYYVSFGAYDTNKTYIYQTDNIENGIWKRYDLNGVYRDAALLFDDNGRVYLVHGGGEIWATELTSDVTAIKKEGFNNIIIEDATKVVGDIRGGLVAEGSHIQKINGKYYIFNIVWPNGGIRTEIVHKADNIEGPYEGKIVLEQSIVGGIAQGGIIDTTAGKWYGMLFEDHGAVGRIPYLIPIIWEEGWPIFGDVNYTGISVEKLKYSFIDSDEFNENRNKLKLVWQWNHNPDNRNWSLIERKGYLRLKNGRKSTNILDAVNTLTQRTFGPKCSGSVEIDISNMKNGDYTGLAAFQQKYGFVGVKMENDCKYLIMVQRNLECEKEIECIPITQNKVCFRIDFDYEDMLDRAYFYYSLSGYVWNKIGQELKLEYTIPHFVGYRFALFSYATKVIGGYVDFDYFRIE